MNVISLDRIEHALGIDHHANPLAGSIVVVDHQDCDDDKDPSHPVSHAHSGQNCQTGIILLTTVCSPVKFVTVAAFSVKQRVQVGEFTSTLDRPPKA
jgi:hypothetical protein